MRISRVDRVARAILYEGYLLYPYRATAVKNRQRFTFGVLYPPAYAETSGGTDHSLAQTECLALAEPSASLRVSVRFLHLAERGHGDEASAPPSLEAKEREVHLGPRRLEYFLAAPWRESFTVDAAEYVGKARGPDGEPLPGSWRRSHRLEGELGVSAEPVADGTVRIRVVVANRLALGGDAGDRDRALLQSLVSAHVVLTLVGGAFVSLIDPPAHLQAAAAACRNLGLWPVLAGEGDGRDVVLASPIILYDHPAVAEETAGDLFDGTEIDEILSLRILTLTDDEKREVRRGDERARRLLDRTESLAAEQIMRLHGTWRSAPGRPEDEP